MPGKRKYGTAPTLRRQPLAAAALFLLLALQCHGLRAELLFRSLEQVNGQQRWSGVRNYGIPTEASYQRSSQAEEVRVFLSGEITRADMVSAEIMTRLIEGGKQKIAGNTLWLASNGGDIDSAMNLGRLLRRFGIFTAVARNDQCISACVFAFMGGERRAVAGRLGIHRPYFSSTQDNPDRQVKFRHLQRVVKGYVEEMDFPASLYEAIMLVPPESMQVVAPADLKRFYLEGMSPTSEDVADAALARRHNLPMAEYLQLKARAPACAIPAADGSCEGRPQDATASGGAGDPGNAKRIGNTRPVPRGGFGAS